MREPLEMVTASLMQNMVHICKKNMYFVAKLLFRMFGKSYFGALGVESPHGGAIVFDSHMHEHCANLRGIQRTSRPQGSLHIIFVITKLTNELVHSSL